MDTRLYMRYWGKARPNPENVNGAQYHLLPFHCLDVAAVGNAWWLLSPSMRQQLSRITSPLLKESQLLAWVLFFVALHDLGKLDIRFQMKAEEAFQKLQSKVEAEDLPPKGEAKDYRHGEEGYAWFVREYLLYLGLDEKNDQVLDAWLPWLGAVAGHHGKIPKNRFPASEADSEPYLIEQDRNARKGWIDILVTLFLVPAGLSLQDTPPPLNSAQTTYLAGFCAICDWVGSNEEWFGYCDKPTNDLVAYFQQRLSYIKQKRVIERCGLVQAVAPFSGVESLLGTNEFPRQLQTMVNALPLTEGLTLIEAPTGSGKTETALAYAWRLLEAGLADSIVFALPTQATANAMWERLKRFAERLFGVGSNLLLAHGKRQHHPGYNELKETTRQHSVQGGEDIRVQCAEWLAESRKRVFLGQIGVCTIDQVLLSVLPLRHKFVRGFGVMKSVLIVDEVHAYDRYMYGLLDGVLRQQQLGGGSAILLSATLPQDQRRKLAEAWGSQSAIISDAPYPLFTHVDKSGGVRFLKLDDPAQQPESRTVVIEKLPLVGLKPDQMLIERLIAAASMGARVAIICNLVNDAQQLARELRAITEIPVDLFHARYRFNDRQMREQAVLKEYGRDAVRGQGRILVATQVVEQSLDLDFDWLITQLCPVDLLFQRLGRLHRHVRVRPQGFERPKATILVAPDADYGLHKVVYGNTRVLWRTQQLLQINDVIYFPAAYREWIEQVYIRDDWPVEPEQISLEYDKFHVIENSKFRNAQRLASDDMNPLTETDDAVRALTRDGEMSLTVMLIDNNGQLLGGAGPMITALDKWERRECIALNAVGVPDSWKKHFPESDEEGVTWLTMYPDGGLFWVGGGVGATFRYSEDYGLEKIIEEAK